MLLSAFPKISGKHNPITILIRYTLTEQNSKVSVQASQNQCPIVSCILILFLLKTEVSFDAAIRWRNIISLRQHIQRVSTAGTSKGTRHRQDAGEICGSWYGGRILRPPFQSWLGLWGQLPTSSHASSYHDRCSRYSVRHISLFFTQGWHSFHSRQIASFKFPLVCEHTLVNLGL